MSTLEAQECCGKPGFHMEKQKAQGTRESTCRGHQRGALHRSFRTARANQRPSLKKQNKHQNTNGARKLLKQVKVFVTQAW